MGTRTKRAETTVTDDSNLLTARGGVGRVVATLAPALLEGTTRMGNKEKISDHPERGAGDERSILGGYSLPSRIDGVQVDEPPIRVLEATALDW